MTDTKWSFALEALERFGGEDLTRRITTLEAELSDRTGADCAHYLHTQEIATPLLKSAYVIKEVAGQINVALHAIGILLCLPHILDPEERIIRLSLGAGNTGKPFDLETDKRIAEFKLITWQGGPEVIRQNALFKDFYELAEYQHPTNPSIARDIYVTGIEHPRRFFRSRRSLKSVMSRNSKLWERFKERHQDRFTTVGDYFASEGGKVHLEDITSRVPALFADIAQFSNTKNLA